VVSCSALHGPLLGLLRKHGVFRGHLTAALRYFKGACQKDGDKLFCRACSDRTRGDGFKLKEGRFRLDTRMNFFSWAGEALAWVAPIGGGCPIPGNIPGQAGRGSEQPDRAEDVPAQCRGLDWMAFKGPSPPKLFCDSVFCLLPLSSCNKEPKPGKRRLFLGCRDVPYGRVRAKAWRGDVVLSALPCTRRLVQAAVC